MKNRALVFWILGWPACFYGIMVNLGGLQPGPFHLTNTGIVMFWGIWIFVGALLYESK
jgi:hypothetical protein